MTLLLPLAIEHMANTYVACKRIQKFLLLDEIQQCKQQPNLSDEVISKDKTQISELIVEKPKVSTNCLVAKWGSVRCNSDEKNEFIYVNLFRSRSLLFLIYQ